MPIRAAVFDWGGTLAQPEPNFFSEVAEEFELTSDEIWAVFRGPTAAESQLTGRRFDLADVRGAMSAALPDRLGARTSAAAARLSEFYVNPDRMIVAPEMLKLLRDLRAAGVPTGCLSNGPPEVVEQSWAPLLKDALPAVAVVSGALGIGKPEPAAFEAVANALEVAPAECVFVDDTEMHVDAARAVGMRAVLFEGDVAAIRSELEAAGLL